MPASRTDSIRFAAPFFTPQYLSQPFLSNFRQLSQSQLSLSFTLHCPNISILESILHDLEVEIDQTEQSTLTEFIFPAGVANRSKATKEQHQAPLIHGGQVSANNALIRVVMTGRRTVEIVVKFSKKRSHELPSYRDRGPILS
ncbi:hypothetical protein KEM48_012865 [Puccinia striiformis f. sp. tritici PST-130]|uniref:Uncharacterized protein n=3 Tax=Puccinia striiformis TaxID=27350 RepID=A0A0L0V5U1_9BASI|nr:hypothetical protein H4Q26_013815 [Puccinia striiformis f. sp. tritici PST-130]KAI9629518.1 hypothetical protein KEM48_012865 [Puccinia striiformis f. sp. tritici PST-130]KNE94670.1 hypothetical protein PSTG_12032 [Puccinia striiformis f. sp. tritici PST-78]